MSNPTCLNCGASEQERPLLSIRFKGNEFSICAQCLPTLIHKPDQLADKLPGFIPSENPTPDD